MPELPDVILYLNSLRRTVGGHRIEKIIVKSPFVLRTFDPPLEDAEGKTIEEFSRIGKRIVWHCEDSLNLVFHLMIAGRFHWRAPRKMPAAKTDLVAFQFEHGTMMFTEASQKKRASLHVIRGAETLGQFDRGGLDPLNCSGQQFVARLQYENRTLKRALTDPRFFSGIGNAYSDEILLRACLSPLKRTSQLKPAEAMRLFDATVKTLQEWIQRLELQAGNSFPKKVTAFRPEMMAHGKYGDPCPQCGKAIQRIVYSENECNYCAGCQTGGKLLADRSLSRLLKDEWPKSIDELES